MAEKEWTFDEVKALYKKFLPDDIDGQGKVVVVAEDQLNMRSIICKALEQKGFKPIPAENGFIALKEIRDKAPDCCILDLGLPQLSGLEVLAAVRRDENFAATPIIICTARKEKEDIICAQRLGVSAYVVKPFEMISLIKRVASACGIADE